MSDVCKEGLNILSYLGLNEGLLTVRCIIIALTISLLLWTGFLYLRICYGQTNINKLTLFPFQMAFAALLAMLLVEILKVFDTAK